ncbi:RWD-domain-containing protein [Cryphonectria parasitica EP155]|uniref:RWD-domain-containing protein n=1 Tax=Cryphonectria parasitica (strain ATCC 38755 / EP155) TaxID=660469 RepID=A0A9P4XWZ2_CRYP1|nr:RWD-domain-containing protein [Cryphonectria parasitica EP155]KAF3762342.1 RWD-domain-containing protein [Cryphonectria parasitica EP155]
MGREEQIEEREVLDSIFPDEITDINETEFRISITLDIEDDEPENPQPVMVLTVRYPADYPDKAPHLDLSTDDGSEKHPLFSVADDKTALLTALGPVIEENMGMAMVFTLVTTLKEEAEQLVLRRREDAARAHEEVLLAAEREENKKFHGTPVTRDTFLQWRDGFIREMEEQRVRDEEERAAEMKKARIKDPTRLTGRQLWESGLAKGEEAEEAEDDAAPVEDIEKLKVSAS